MKDVLRGLGAEYTDPPADDAPLALDSLSMVTLIESLEDRFDIRVAPRDVNADNFGSIDKLAAYIERSRA